MKAQLFLMSPKILITSELRGFVGQTRRSPNVHILLYDATSCLQYYFWRLPIQGMRVLITFVCGKICSPFVCTLLTFLLRGPHRNKHSFHFTQRFQTAPGYCWPTLCKIIFEWIHWSPGIRLQLELKIFLVYHPTFDLLFLHYV